MYIESKVEKICLCYLNFLFFLHPSSNAKSVIGFFSFRSRLFSPFILFLCYITTHDRLQKFRL